MRRAAPAPVIPAAYAPALGGSCASRYYTATPAPTALRPCPVIHSCVITRLLGAAVTAISSPIGGTARHARRMYPEAARPVAETRKFRHRAASKPGR